MKSVLQWLEASAAQYPMHVAALDPHEALTYAQLLCAAQASGQKLITTYHATPRRAVAFYLEKSVRALVGICAVLYAGDFYSILDTRQPTARTKHCIETLDPVLVVAQDDLVETLQAALANTAYRVVALSDVVNLSCLPSQTVCSCQCTQPLSSELACVRAQMCDVDPMYVNFTSGSTGTPKGVVIAHSSVLDFIPVFTSTFGLASNDIFANQAPFDFDVSVKDIYSCWYLGATLVIIPREYFSIPTKLMDYLIAHRVTVLVWAVSALCFISIMNGFEYACPTTIRRVMFSGEVMPPKQLRKWQSYMADTCMFVNLYGPTEITCNCAYFIVDRPYENNEVIPMGHAFDNERIYLLDENNQEISEPHRQGEICVAGRAVGLGYFADSEKTAVAFVQNPLHTRWLERVYRTGDMAYFDDAHNLVYASRKDFQIKHLGHRIELGDIEAAATSVTGVEQAICLYDSKKHRLHLYYVGACEKDALVHTLHTLLPAFMIPNTTNNVPAMPLTKNGKVDRNKLARL